MARLQAIIVLEVTTVVVASEVQPFLFFQAGPSFLLFSLLLGHASSLITVQRPTPICIQTIFSLAAWCCPNKVFELYVSAAVILTEGFDYLKENCPWLQSEILRTVAGCEKECSSGGKSQSVWGQLSDGGDTNGRRVRPRV
jgi:hypothetical protein